MKKRIQYKEPDMSRTRDKTASPSFLKTECLESCPHLIYNRKGSQNIHAHCMKYCVPLDSEHAPGRIFPLVKRHTSCRKDFPEDSPKSFNPDETRIVKVPKP